MKTRTDRNNTQPENSNKRKANFIEQPNEHKRKDDRAGISKEDAGSTGLGHKAGQGREDRQFKK